MLKEANSVVLAQPTYVYVAKDRSSIQIVLERQFYFEIVFSQEEHGFIIALETYEPDLFKEFLQVLVQTFLAAPPYSTFKVEGEKLTFITIPVPSDLSVMISKVIQKIKKSRTSEAIILCPITILHMFHRAYKLGSRYKQWQVDPVTRLGSLL